MPAPIHTYRPSPQNDSRTNVARPRLFLEVLRDRARELGYVDPVCRDCRWWVQGEPGELGRCLETAEYQLDLGVCETWSPLGPRQLRLG